MLKALQNSLVSLVYPQNCRICDSLVDNINFGVACSACWAETRLFSGEEMLCGKCGAFFNPSGVKTDIRCHQCDGHFYDKAKAAGIYEKALAVSAIHLKSQPYVPTDLKHALLAAFDRSPFSITTLIIPVPLSRMRRRERGFNQAEILAALVSKHTSIKLDMASLARSKHTPMHRIAMDKKARELTVANAFEVTRPNLIANQKILLIDDIFTSGATASACAKVLKKNGATEVNVLTLARAIMQ